MEEVQLLAELAVVPLARFFLLLEPGVQVLLVEERRPVDALQLRVPVIASPVRAGDVEQLDDADLSSRGRVRAQAEIDPIAVAIERQRLGALGEDVVDDLRLELLAQLVEQGERLFLGDFLFLDLGLAEDQFLEFVPGPCAHGILARLPAGRDSARSLMAGNGLP